MPNRFSPISPSSDLPAIVNQINKNFSMLDQEAVTKKFGQGSESLIIGKTGDDTLGTKVIVGDLPVMIIGKYRTDRYGIVMYQAGVPVELTGMAPDDGRMGHWIARPGQNVLTLLGG